MASDEQMQELEATAKYWWVLLLQGAVIAFIGWFLLRSPAITVIQLAVVLGLYLLISGIVDVTASLFEIGHKGSRWGLKLFGGLVNVIIGLFVLNNPIFTGLFTPVFIMYFVAFGFIINGIIHMTVGNQDRAEGQHEWSWGSFFLGLLYLIFGFMLLSSPTLVSTATVVWVGGLLGLIGGIGMIILSFQVKGLKKS
ncbi:HdeD family acid-resistance protein [Patescibacteria group bacterium]